MTDHVPPWLREIDDILPHHLLGDKRPLDGLKLATHVQVDGDRFFVPDAAIKSGGARLRLSGKDAKQSGRIFCTSCRGDKWQGNPCKHIVAVIEWAGLYPQPAPRPEESGWGVFLSDAQRRELDIVRVPLMYQRFAEFLGALPEELGDALKAEEGRDGRPWKLVFYAGFHWTLSGLSMNAAVHSLCEEFHRGTMWHGFRYSWTRNYKELPLTGYKVQKPPISANTLSSYFDRKEVHDLGEWLVSLFALFVAEFETIGTGDGTGFQLHQFSAYCEDRIRDMEQKRKNRAGKAKELAESAVKHGDATQAGSPKAGHFENGIWQVTKEFEKMRRSRQYLKVVPFCLYLSGMVASLVTEVKGGEQPTLIPLLERAMMVAKKLRLTAWDAGYVKAANALWGRIHGVRMHIEESAIEQYDARGDNSLAKKARNLDRHEMEMYPEQAAHFHGIRQKSEVGHAQMKRLFGALIRTRVFRESKRAAKRHEAAKGMPLDAEDIECKARKDASRRRGRPEQAWNHRTEAVFHYLVLNTYLLVRWGVKMRCDAKDGLGANWTAWTPQGEPNWQVIRDFAATPHKSMTDLAKEFGGSNKTVSDALVAAAGGHVPMALRSPEEAAQTLA